MARAAGVAHLRRNDLGRVNVLWTNAQTDDARRDASQHRKRRQRAHYERRLLPRAGGGRLQEFADESALNEELDRLRRVGRKLTTALYGGEVGFAMRRKRRI